MSAVMLPTILAPTASIALALCGTRGCPDRDRTPRQADEPAAAPLYVVNVGQWDPAYLWRGIGGASMIGGLSEGFVLSLGAESSEQPVNTPFTQVFMLFEGANPAPVLESLDPPHHIAHFIDGPGTTTWRPGVPVDRSLLLRELYPGVSLRVRSSSSRAEYDFLCREASQLHQVSIRVAGATGIRIDSTGQLVVEADEACLTQSVPISSWTDTSGECHSEPCKWVILGTDRVGLLPPDIPALTPVLVDPTLEFSTFLGFLMDADSTCLAVGSDGGALLSTITSTPSFMTTPGAYDTTYNDAGGPGLGDVVVLKMNSSGTGISFSTFIGGNSKESPPLLATDPSGNAYLTGYTVSSNFPTTPGAPLSAPLPGSIGGAYLLRLSSNGNALVFSSFFASGWCWINGVAADSGGVVYGTGIIQGSALLTTPNAFKPQGAADMYVVKMDTTSSVQVFGTFFASTSNNGGYAIATDSSGAVWVLGVTDWAGMPTTSNALDASFSGPIDTMLVRFSAAGDTLEYATFLDFGGSATALKGALSWRDPYLYIFMQAHSALPTTPGAYLSSTMTQGPCIMKVDPQSGSIVVATYVLEAFGIVRGFGVDESGNSYYLLTGASGSGPYPTTFDAFKNAEQNGDYYFVKLNESGTGVLFASYFGGSGPESAGRIVGVGANGCVISGVSTSPDFPTTPGAYNTTSLGYTLTKIDLPAVPYGTARFGSGTPGCRGVQAISVNKPAQLSANNFRFLCDSAPSNALGLVILSDQADVTGSDVLGVGVSFHIGLFTPAVAGIDLVSDLWGSAMTAGFTLPSNPQLAGATYYSQAFWSWPPSVCTPSPFGLSASNGLAITILP